MERIYSRQSRGIALGLALALTLLAFAVALLISRGHSTPLKSAVRLNALATSNVQVYGDNIYYFESGSLHCMNTSGGYEWNFSLGGSYQFKVSANGIALWSGSTFRVMDKDTGKETGTTSLSGSLSGSTISSNAGEIISGYVGNTYAAAQLAPEHNSTMVITDLECNIVDTIDDLSNLTVLDFGFFDKYALFWLMTLDATGSEPTSSISTYIPGQKNNPKITDLDQFIYKVYSYGNYIYAIGTNYMRVYDYKGTEQTDKAVTVYGYTLETINEDTVHPLMIFIPNSENASVDEIQDLRLLRDGVSTNLHLPIPCMRVMVKGDTIYGFSGSSVAVAHYGSNDVKCYSLPISISSVTGIADDLTCVVKDASAYYLIKLPE